MSTVAVPKLVDPETVADLLHRLGGIPPERVLLRPLPGTATEQDLIELLDGPNKRICELVEGVLVEKAMGFSEGFLALVIGQSLLNYLDKHDVGLLGGADSPVRLRLGLVRFPDICFISWKRLRAPELPSDPISKAIPELAIEILSKGNTRREIDRKLDEYFRAGVLLAWVIDPKTQTAEVYTSTTNSRRLDKKGVLEGGMVLPKFRLPLKKLFDRAKRKREK